MDLYYQAEIAVFGADLRWIDRDGTVRRLQEAPHAEFARLVQRGVAPEVLPETQYAREHVVRFVDHVEGDPQRFVALVGAFLSSHGVWPADMPRVQVAVEPDGAIIVVDGLHRSAAALAAGCPVACRVVYRAPRWVRLRNLLQCCEPQGAALYQPVGHPDIDWPVHRCDTEERVAILGAYLARCGVPRQAVGVDYGGHIGAVAAGLAGAGGYDLHSYDSDPNCVLACAALAAGPWRDRIAPGRLTAHSTPATLPRQAAFSVCLSLLHHMWSAAGRREQAEAIAADLLDRAPLLLLDEPAGPEDRGGADGWHEPGRIFAALDAVRPGRGEVIALRTESNGLARPLLAFRRTD